jgi:hypothetical protein
MFPNMTKNMEKFLEQDNRSILQQILDLMKKNEWEIFYKCESMEEKF